VRFRGALLAWPRRPMERPRAGIALKLTRMTPHPNL
jgi:hypothetical protein